VTRAIRASSAPAPLGTDQESLVHRESVAVMRCVRVQGLAVFLALGMIFGCSGDTQDSEVVLPPADVGTTQLPSPFNVTEVRIPGEGNLPPLAGTLTWPAEGCPCPAAILLQGVGSHDRDYTLFDKKPFALLADQLARNGIATLRFDERGVGLSEGEAGSATLGELAEDVFRWMDFLKARSVVNGERIGVVGHSEGGMVGSLVAAGRPELAFLVMLASPGLSGVRTPVLAVLGEKDVQVPPQEYREALLAALDTGSGRDRVVVLPGLNHFMQTSVTGSPREYPEIQEAMAPAALDLITLWARTHTGTREVGSCTVLHASDGEVSLGASNEDWTDPLTHFWIIPPKNGDHGWVKFGFAGGFPQAGMNDQGVFWDATGSPYLAMPRSEATKTFFDGPLMVRVMEEAASVEEAREIFGASYCEDQYRAQYLIGDAGGASIIVEGDSILAKEGRAQVLTNFYQSRPDLGGYPCGRFATATQMLAEAGSITPLLMGMVLDATRQAGKYPTQYSIIYDLKGLRSYLFYYHNFHEYLAIDLQEEFQKGARDYAIPPLFSQIRLLSPEHEATAAGSSVQLRWRGNRFSSYQLCYGTSPQAGGSCFPFQPTIVAEDLEGGPLLGSLSLILVVLAVPFRRVGRRRRVVLFVALLLVVWVACGSGPTRPGTEDPEVTEMAHTLTSRQPSTTYYWKLRAEPPGGSEFSTETILFSFTTGG